MSAFYLENGATAPVQLDARATVPVSVSTRDVQDPERLARILQDLVNRQRETERRWNPNQFFRRDLTVDALATTKYRIEHGFNGRVNWYVGRWRPSVDGTGCRVTEHSDSDANALVLVSGAAGTVTILVEAAG